MSEPGDEGAMEEGSNYTFRLHVAQLAGGGERTRRDLGRIAFRADELFEEEDALAAGAMAHVLKRFGDKTGFEVAAFEHGDTVIRDNTALDECLAAIEDAGFSTAGLSVGLRPVCEFRLFTDGTPEAVAVLKHEVATAKWEWMKKELFRISGGKDTAFRYTREGLRDGVLLPPTPVIVDDEVSFVACLQHLLARDDGDFSIEAALIPAPTSVKVGAAPAGRADAHSSEGQARNLASIELSCSMPAGSEAAEGGGDAPIKVGSVRTGAGEALGRVLDRINALPRIPPGMAAVAFSYSGRGVDAPIEVHGSAEWLKCQRALQVDDSLLLSLEVTLILAKSSGQAVPGGSVQASDPVKIDATQDAGLQANPLLDETGDEGGEEAGSGVAGRVCAPREPMRSVMLMCYDSDNDPVRMAVKVDATWQDLSSRLHKMFGERVFLSYSVDASTVAHVASEQELRSALDAVQRLWQLGGGDGCLHAAVVPAAASELPASSSAVQKQGSTLAVHHQVARGLNVLHVAAAESASGAVVKAAMVGNVHDGVSTRIPADTPDEHGATALHYAAAAGAVDAAEALLKDGANPNEEDERLTAPLHCATGGVGALLLDYKARVNTRDSAGWTPLHRAAALDDTDFARMLLDYGADIDAVTSTGRTPLHVSALHGAEAVSEMLLAEGADVLAKDADGHRANDLAKFRLLAGLKTAHKVACAGERARRRTVEQAEEGSARDIAARLLKQLQDMSRLERARAGQSAAGARDEDLFTLFNTHDSSGDGVLTAEEFHAALEARPIEMRLRDREKLYRYMDVDGDGTVDLMEFVSTVVDAPPPSGDRDCIRVAVDQIKLRGPLLDAATPKRFLVSVDFLSQYRDGRVPRSVVLQTGSTALRPDNGWIQVAHQKRMLIDAKSNANRRSDLLDLLVKNEELVRAEVLLFVETPSASGAPVWTELAGGIVPLAPDRPEATSASSHARVLLYSYIRAALELPASWREFSHPDMLAVLARVPFKVQRTVRPGARGTAPSRPSVVEALTEWERADAEQALCHPPKAGDPKARRALMEPIAEAAVSVTSLQALDTIVVEAAKVYGLESLSDRWQARWKLL